MLEASNNNELPVIPGKRYFTIGEVSELCGVKPHVLRYWEQEFPQLKPVKRRGNRRYYQRQDVLMIRQIRSLLYEQGFTIGGAQPEDVRSGCQGRCHPEPADRAPGPPRARGRTATAEAVTVKCKGQTTIFPADQCGAEFVVCPRFVTSI